MRILQALRLVAARIVNRTHEGEVGLKVLLEVFLDWISVSQVGYRHCCSSANATVPRRKGLLRIMALMEFNSVYFVIFLHMCEV